MKRTAQSDLIAVLRAEGVRITRQRRTLVKIIAEAIDHPDANEIHRRAYAFDPSISLATVYRTMQILERRGIIYRHSFQGAPARFEAAGGKHHDHIVDVDTGQVIEFASPAIERLQASIAAELGYDIIRRRLEIYGRRKK